MGRGKEEGEGGGRGKGGEVGGGGALRNSGSLAVNDEKPKKVEESPEVPPGGPS